MLMGCNPATVARLRLMLARTPLYAAIQRAISPPAVNTLWHLGNELKIDAPQRRVTQAELAELAAFARANHIPPNENGDYQLLSDGNGKCTMVSAS